jgi:ABC-2 type transport system ATP-binding protein
MWNLVADLRKSGVTIILTTHYIDEAEQMADRIGVIQAGKIILIEEKEVLMKKLGQKELHLELFEPIKEIPQNLASSNLKLSADGGVIIFTYDATKKNNGIANLLEEMKQNGIVYQDLKTHQSSLEDIFIQLVK